MNRIYLDQASTSFPKAPGVAQAMMDYLTMNGVNVNRGCYSSAYSAEEVIYETRQLLAELFHFSKCKNVIFTPNVTTSLNFILKGFLKPGDHILVSAMEHNAVMRPVVQLASSGISFDRIPCRTDGSMILEKVEELIRPETKAIVTLHASNVCATAEQALAKRKGVCQDYAHVMLSVCRHVGLTARYIAGLLGGEGATHAWVEVYQDGRWVGLDPTHNRLVDDNYITIAHGRDYRDCMLDIGIFSGYNVQQSQWVNASVHEQVA